jgi:hypothetical protein
VGADVAGRVTKFPFNRVTRLITHPCANMFSARAREARESRHSGDSNTKVTPRSSSSSAKVTAAAASRWHPWADGVAPTRWEDSGAEHSISNSTNGSSAVGVGSFLDPSAARWEHDHGKGKLKFRADFDGGNLAKVRGHGHRGGPASPHAP